MPPRGRAPTPRARHGRLPRGRLGVKSAHDKLGSDDVGLLAKAKAHREKNVTMMIATAPGRTEQVTRELDAVKGGSVRRTYDELGYVRPRSLPRSPHPGR